MYSRTAIDWCRDVDYGSLPQWLALIVGAVVAGFTIFGILTARRAYLDDVRTRTFAQARLIYGEIVEDLHIGSGVTQLVSVTDPKARIVQLPDEGQPMPVSHGTRYQGPTLSLTANMDARVFLVRVTNNSEELISKVDISLKDEDGMIGGQVADVLLAPKSMVEWVVAIPEDREFKPKEATVTFTDATGGGWIRRGGEPLEPFPPETKKARQRYRDPAKSLSMNRRHR